MAIFDAVAARRLEQAYSRPDVAEQRAQTYSQSMLDIISRFVVARAGVTRKMAEEWVADVRSQAERSEYFFSLCRYLFVADRSAAGHHADA